MSLPVTPAAAARLPRRVATLSVHTSPLEQPGAGDAGGLNVYVCEIAKRLARVGIEVEIFTRATASELPPVVELAPGVQVRHITAGPYEGLDKTDLPAQLCAFTSGVLRVEAMHEPGYFDLVHSHYWLSGQVGWLVKERWGVPLVHSMHTMAKVKNAALAAGDAPEPTARAIGEAQVVAAADRLVASTADEADQLVALYDADPTRVRVVPPGVDLDVFIPGDPVAARRRLGLADDAIVLLFAGRIQPLKAPDVVVDAAALLSQLEPSLADRVQVVIVGGPSGNDREHPQRLRARADELGIGSRTRFVPPVEQRVLADYYRAAAVTVVPSHSESFGLVAIESQSVGTPVIAASVDGLRYAVADGRSGLLVEGHDPHDYATAIRRVVTDATLHRRLRHGAVEHAGRFGWDRTAAALLGVYREALAPTRPIAAVG